MCLSCEPTSLSPCPVKIHSRTRETNTINVSKAIINQPYKLMVLYHLLMVNWGLLVYYCFTIGLDPIPKQAFLGEHLVLEGRDWWNQGEPSRFNMLFDSHICWRVEDGCENLWDPQKKHQQRSGILVIILGSAVSYSIVSEFHILSYSWSLGP
jgi:hypothetical protein